MLPEEKENNNTNPCPAPSSFFYSFFGKRNIVGKKIFSAFCCIVCCYFRSKMSSGHSKLFFRLQGLKKKRGAQINQKYRLEFGKEGKKEKLRRMIPLLERTRKKEGQSRWGWEGDEMSTKKCPVKGKGIRFLCTVLYVMSCRRIHKILYGWSRNYSGCCLLLLILPSCCKLSLSSSLPLFSALLTIPGVLTVLKNKKRSLHWPMVSF